MHEADIVTVLAEAVEEVLEKMFFARALADPSPVQNQSGSGLGARVAFEGMRAGTLTLRIDAAAARSIAADFLGEDDDMVSGRQIKDVICELTNIVCGSVLSRLDTTADFRLEDPVLVTPGAASEERCKPAEAISLDKGSLSVVLKLETPACPRDQEFAY